MKRQLKCLWRVYKGIWVELGDQRNVTDHDHVLWDASDILIRGVGIDVLLIAQSVPWIGKSTYSMFCKVLNFDSIGWKKDLMCRNKKTLGHNLYNFGMIFLLSVLHFFFLSLILSAIDFVLMQRQRLWGSVIICSSEPSSNSGFLAQCWEILLLQCSSSKRYWLCCVKLSLSYF